jgi:aldehyde dehydrogenase
MLYVSPNQHGSKVAFRSRYQNFIAGEWVAPVKGQYFENVTPVTGRPFCEVPRSTVEDIEKALDAAHAAKIAWGKRSPADRAVILCKIADRIEQNVEKLAVAETWDNGKPIRETLAADLPLIVDCFRYFASCLRCQEGSISQLDDGTVAYHFREPLGVVGQIVPWSFPLLTAVSKLAPALAAGNCVVLKPSEQTPASILVLAELISDLLPSGVLNVVNGFGVEAGKALASSKRVAKLAFTGEMATARLMLQCACENLTPVALEVGGKSPNVFFEDVLAKNDDFAEKVMEGFAMFALNQGEVCPCPSRAVVHEKIFSQFMERAIACARRYLPGNPLDPTTTVGAQVCKEQLDKILSSIDAGKKDGAKVLLGGERVRLGGELEGGYYVLPTIFQGNGKMRMFQEEVFGPVVSAASFKDFDDALAIVNDTRCGQGAGIWTRDAYTAYRAGRAIQAGRVWTNCYHVYPAQAAFGGYNQCGIGGESHCTILGQYQQTKNLVVSYDPKPIGRF